MAEIIQPEGVDMFQMDLEHIHAVLRNRSYDMESFMMRVSARCACVNKHEKFHCAFSLQSTCLK
jgi:hypothetical protein